MTRASLLAALAICLQIGVKAPVLRVRARASVHAQAGGSILFQDNFTKGFNPHWGFVSKTVHIVPINPRQPHAGYAARFTASPAPMAVPLKPGDWKPTSAKIPMLEKKWRDYVFRFRWRIAARLENGHKNLPQGTLFAVSWHLLPLRSTPQLCDAVFIGVAGDHWVMHGPLVPWYGGVNRPFEPKNIFVDHRRRSSEAVPWGRVDQKWHTFKVVVGGGRSSIYWDGRLLFVGSDLRAPYGGVGFGPLWGDSPVEWLEVSNVVVRELRSP